MKALSIRADVPGECESRSCEEQMKQFGVVAAIAVIGFGPVVRGPIQATGCAAMNWPALQPSDPAYSDATDFARVLADHGFVVQCIAPSKMTSTFEGQVGAALYRTNQGSVDVLFLPKTETFGALEIVARRESGRYLYSFAGRPKPWPANLIDASHPVHFVKNLNRLLIADDEALAAHLESTLGHGR